MKMAGLCWMAVTLVWFLSAGNSLAAVDQNRLAGLVQEVLDKYTPPSYVDKDKVRRIPMFSLAVTIPDEGGTYKVDDSKDPGQNVKNTIQQCDVYEGTRVVAATVLKWPNVLKQCPNGQVQWGDVRTKCGYHDMTTSLTWADVNTKCPDAVTEGRADHAEWRTLQSIDKLVKNLNPNDFMLFYVRSSPCDEKCTNEIKDDNILIDIHKIENGDNFAFVFSDLFEPGGKRISEDRLRKSIGKFEDQIGLENVFRCNSQGNAMQCTSCASDGQVTKYCYSDTQGGSGEGGSSSGGQPGGKKGKPSGSPKHVN